jgi:hypothetical protein
MKNLILAGLVFISITILAASCTPNPDHSIRVKNSFHEALTYIKINGTNYGRIERGSVTEYLPVEEGNFSISGSTSSGNSLSGSGTVSGPGSHKWTLTINGSGSASIEED